MTAESSPIGAIIAPTRSPDSVEPIIHRVDVGPGDDGLWTVCAAEAAAADSTGTRCAIVTGTGDDPTHVVLTLPRPGGPPAVPWPLPADGPPGHWSRLRLPEGTLGQRLAALARSAGTSEEAILLAVWHLALDRLLAGTPTTFPITGSAGFTGPLDAWLRSITDRPGRRTGPDATESLATFARRIDPRIDRPDPALTGNVGSGDDGAGPVGSGDGGAGPVGPGDGVPTEVGVCLVRAPVVVDCGAAVLRVVDMTRYTAAPLALSAVLDQDGGHLTLRYDEHVVPAPTARHLLSCVTALLAEIDPQETVILARQRLRRLLRHDTVGPTVRPDGPDRYPSAAHAFAAVARVAGQRTALRHRDTSMTYQRLAGLAGGVGTWLRSQGIRPGALVATLVTRSPAAVVAALGSWGAGAAYVHLEPADPDNRTGELLAAAGPAAVVVDRASLSRLPSTDLPVCVLDDVVPADGYQPPEGLGPTDRAYVVFTSGSTGAPKGVEVEHGALLNYQHGFAGRIAPLAPGSFGLTTTFASDLGKTVVYGALLTGGRLDIYDRELTLDPYAFAEELRHHPVGCLKYTPSHLAALAGRHELAALLPTDLLVLGGEALPPSLIGAIRAARPDLSVFNHYGPTETTIGVLMHRAGEGDVGRARVPVGTPLAGVRVRLLDDAGEPVLDGVPGILHVGGACLARGYLDDPGLTSARFTADPVEPGQRWYRTGDVMVRSADGELEFLRRADRQLKIRGNRVEPGEVEAALVALADVVQAVVTGERSGPGEPMELVAYVVGPAPDRVPGLIGELTAVLPAALLPGRITAVPEIPVTLNGKVDLDALRSRYAPGPPEVATSPDFAAAPDVAASPGVAAARDGSGVRDVPGAPGAAGNGSGGPAGGGDAVDTEQLVASVWCEVLGVSAIDRDEKFAALGGDSFKTLAVFGRLRRHFPTLGIAMLFKHPSVAELSAALDRMRGSA